MDENEELAVIRSYQRMLGDLEIISQLAETEWVSKTLVEVKEQLKKFRGY